MKINQKLENLYNDLIEGNAPMKENIDEVVEYIKSKEVIVYGAGNVGKSFYDIFERLNIKISYYTDRYAEQLKKVNEVPIKSPENMKFIEVGNGIEEKVVIIAAGTNELVNLIEQDLNQINTDVNRINGFYLVYVLQYHVCSLKWEDGESPNLMKCTSYHVKPYKCPIFCKNVEKLACEDNPFEETDGSKFNEVGYLLGQVCTLKCKHCLEAVPYLEKKEILPVNTILKDIKKLSEACRFIHRLDLVGGEPFLHPEFNKLIGSILGLKKIGYIGVFTNGTVVPNDELCNTFKNNRIIVTVADYGEGLPDKFKKNVKETLEKLKKYDIQHFYYPNRFWLDINGFNKHDTGDEELERNFRTCFLAACRRIYNGTLYHCPYQCNGVKLQKLNKNDEECIDIHKYTTAELSTVLDRFEDTKFIDACRYCNIPVGAKEVPAGEQL